MIRKMNLYKSWKVQRGQLKFFIRKLHVKFLMTPVLTLESERREDFASNSDILCGVKMAQYASYKEHE